MKKEISKNSVVIYQAKNGAIELRGDFSRDTVWATQAQIASAFDVDVRTINEHIKNIYKTKELFESSTIRKFRIVQKEGERKIEREINHYNLDMILSVGYRVNSKKATQFRQWATKTLRGHIVDGYTINKKRITQNYEQFLEAISTIKKLLPSGAHIDTESVIELIHMFADTWLSLDAYDRDVLVTKGATRKSVSLTADKLSKSLVELKNVLIEKDEATDIFGMERNEGTIAGIVGNVMQSFAGKELYETVEEKAAHLLYFMVKNHPFVDGNKRSGAYAFVWFLKQSKLLNTTKMTPPALTALTILVAESNPKDKEKIIKLILQLLK
ncbi:MAG: virulence protein RhuM/Fic/DOC family protein [bacterium]